MIGYFEQKKRKTKNHLVNNCYQPLCNCHPIGKFQYVNASNTINLECKNCIKFQKHMLDFYLESTIKKIDYDSWYQDTVYYEKKPDNHFKRGL